MRKIVYDSRGKIPRFVVHEDVVVNQQEGGEVSYTDKWMPAYIKLYKEWLSAGKPRAR